MGIQFDETAANDFVHTARRTAGVLRNQSARRHASADNAAFHFTGPYADLFKTCANAESIDRARIASQLEQVADSVDKAIIQARLERKRLAKVEEWLRATYLARVDGGVSDYILPARRPSFTPFANPVVSAAFKATERNHTPVSNRNHDKVSADIEALRSFVSVSQSQNNTLRQEIRNISRAWRNFSFHSSWVSYGNTSLFNGEMDNYLFENTRDAQWIALIADQFAASNGGELSAFEISINVARGWKESEEILSNPNLTAKELEQAVSALAKDSSNHYFLAKYADTKLGLLTLESTSEEINKATAVLEGISKSPEASAELLMTMGGEKLITRTSLSGAFTRFYDYPNESSALLHAIKKVFVNGETELGNSNPNKSKALASSLVTYISGKRIGSLYPGGDGAALSWLLCDAKLSTPFLVELGNGLDKFERSFRDHDNYSWGVMTGAGPTSISEVFPKDYKLAAFDPMASYMSALGHNAKAALEFFASDSMTDEQKVSRQRFWIEQRDWSHNKFTGLLSALDAATTTPGQAGTPAASGLTSSLVEMLANRTQGEDSSGNSLKFHSNQEKFLPGSLSSLGAVKIAHIFSTYMPAVDVYVNKPTEADSLANSVDSLDREDLNYMKSMPKFTRGNLTRVLRTVVSSKDGFGTLGEGVANYKTARISLIIKQHYGTKDFNRLLNLAAESEGGLEGFYTSVVGESLIDSADSESVKAQSWIELGDTLRGLLPIKDIPVAGKFLDFLAEQSLEAGRENIDEAISDARRNAVENASELKIKNLTSSQVDISRILFENDVLTMDEVKIYIERKYGDDSLSRVWFPDGKFPSSEMINSDHRLRTTLENIGKIKYDLKGYMTNFERVFFEKVPFPQSR
ncbi:RAQPRD family integrative conjugative element protein [Actinomycetaceae bacterium TAE3-ERU4]|nr:RAQPRD family integrative conjugative element protein [Actinomycetaceae bacterium TAE3-ERU4]